jgi:hypothetical protein
MNSAIGSYSNYFNPLTIQLSDDPQSSRYTIVRAPIPESSFQPSSPVGHSLSSRYTITRVSIPERPVQPSLPAIEPLSLEGIDAVPEELHEDALFEEHTDPISLEPILDPVADKNEPKHIYERATIVRWLKTNHTSPLTRKPMTEADLLPIPDLKERINEKIRNHLFQTQPELLQKYTEKVEEANKHYQEALDIYAKVDLPKYEEEHQNFLSKKRVSLVAERCLADSGWSLNFNGRQSLRGRISVISTSNPLISRVQSIAGLALETSQSGKAFNPFEKF